MFLKKHNMLHNGLNKSRQILLETYYYINKYYYKQNPILMFVLNEETEFSAAIIEQKLFKIKSFITHYCHI